MLGYYPTLNAKFVAVKVKSPFQADLFHHIRSYTALDRLSAVLRHEIHRPGITATHEDRWSHSVAYNGQEVAACIAGTRRRYRRLRRARRALPPWSVDST
jgi:hypothetical protein